MNRQEGLLLIALVLCVVSCQVTDKSNTSDVFILVSHPQLTGKNKVLEKKQNQFLDKCISGGTGILRFDPLLPSSLLSYTNNESGTDPDVGELKFSKQKHYITEYHQAGELQDLFALISLPKMKTQNATALICGNNLPLLVVIADTPGKVVQWTSQDWMYRSVLGPWGACMIVSGNPLSGHTDVPTSCFIYTEEDGKIVERMVDVPVFENEVAVEIALNLKK